MAKKTAKGGPQKECPKCKAMVHARKTACTCGHTFTFKEKTPKPVKTHTAIDLHTALPIIDKMGGVKAIKTAVEAYYKAEESLKALGGVESAETLLEEIEVLRAVLGK